MKKFLAIALALLMCLGILAACSGEGETKQDVKISNFPTLTYLYNTSDGHKAIGEYIQAALANAGITINLENQEWGTFLNTRKDGNYSIARNGWLADYNDPICFLDMWTSNSGNNDIQYGKGAHANLAMYDLDLTPYGYDTKVEDGTWAQTYDVLIATIKGCTNTETRYALMHLAEDMLMDTGCIVPLYFYTDLYMIDDSVKGFFSNPLGYKYFMYTTIDGKDTIDVCLASEPDTLDPALNSAVDGATMLAHLFSGIAKWAQDSNGALTILPDCATDLPEGVLNEDGTVTYTYTLKDGLTWSNGDPLTASDFVFAWNRAASQALGADYGYMFEVIKGYGDVASGVEGAKLAVEAPDDKTLVVTLANSISYWNELLAFPTYYPVHQATVASESWATDPSTYVCNGPYTMAGWEHGSIITLTKNDSFHNAAEVTMPTIKCHLSDDSNNMLANFKNGTWLLIDDVPTNEIAALKTDYPNEFVVAGQIGTYYVCWNINERILPADSTLEGVEAETAQAEIRRAISLLFDRNYIVNDIAQGGQVPASSFVAMGMTNPDGTQFYKTAHSTNDAFDGYYDVSEAAFESNVDKALEVLTKYYK
jgi:ABC-type oligopeptide transport system substrate-binding subunit